MLYEEQIAALRRIFRPIGVKGATVINLLRASETPVPRGTLAERLYPGNKGQSSVDNLLSTSVRPYLEQLGITLRNEHGQGWYLLPCDRDKLTKLMERPPEALPDISEESSKLQRLTVYVRQEDLNYYVTSARIRNVPMSRLTRRLFTIIAQDKMVEAILDDGPAGNG